LKRFSLSLDPQLQFPLNLKLLMEPFLHFHLHLQCLCNLLAPVVTNQFDRVSDKEVS
jgi:hypothetical protein